MSGVKADDLANQQSIGDAVRQMMNGSQLVGHGMADSQKGVGKSHAGQRGGVGHLFPGDGVFGALFVGNGEVLED